MVPGHDPTAAWDEYNQHPEIMDEMLVAMYASGWQVEDFCPVLWDSTVVRVTQQLGGADIQEARSAWRTWQLGSARWVSPLDGAIPNREAGRAHTRNRVHRAMWSWLASTAAGARVMNRLREMEIAHRAGVGVHRRFLDGKGSGEWFCILKVKVVT